MGRCWLWAGIALAGCGGGGGGNSVDRFEYDDHEATYFGCIDGEEIDPPGQTLVVRGDAEVDYFGCEWDVASVDPENADRRWETEAEQSCSIPELNRVAGFEPDAEIEVLLRFLRVIEDGGTAAAAFQFEFPGAACVILGEVTLSVSG